MHTPYLNYYTRILNENGVDYDIINWNKLNINENVKGYTYNFKCDYETNAINKIKGYYLFSRFVRKTLKKENYDKLIVFIPQLALFINDLLKHEYKGKYILDIRDFGKANRYSEKLDSIINNSEFTVISSKGYKSWLPSKYNYVISHNTLLEKNSVIKKNLATDLRNKKEVIISNIGVIRNYDENCKLIDALSNSNRFKLKYIGEGISEDDLRLLCKQSNVYNVTFFGRYKKAEELEFYQKSDIINVITPKKKIGNHTAMANRFYNACISKRPMLVTKGSYMAEVLKKHDLGIELDLDNDNIPKKIDTYINRFDYKKFSQGCNDFLNEIENDQKIFVAKVTEFIKYK